MQRPPLDVRHPPLRAAVGGYDRSAVYAFLDRAAEDYDAARAALDELRAEHADVKAALEAALDHEREVARVLSAAEQAAGQILERARELALERINAAEGAAANLLRQAEDERARVLAEIDRTRDRTARVVRVLEAEIADLQAPVADAPVSAVEPLPSAASTAAASANPLSQQASSSAPIAVEVGKPSAPFDDPRIPRPEAETLAAGPGLPESGPVSLALAAVQETAGAPDDGPRTEGERTHVPAPGIDGPALTVDLQPAADAQSTAAARSRGRLWVAAAAAVVAIVSAAAIPWLGAADAPVPQVHRPAPSAPPKVAAPPVPAPAAAASLPQTRPADPPAPAPDAITVQLEAKSDCWVRLTIEGYSEERLLAAGETLERTSTTDVVLRTGNAGALIVTVNGRAIPPIGGEGEVVTRRITRPIPVSH